ncbi:hypothetical protein Pres01_44620 [Metapseudomonas resinovorans]|uniref:sulfotransferase family 2 domain-containing protein n=1 Tax=Metapseudomonas resinovorans TaxID=53412 RepID=UPI000987CC03|nr:sulfotransferase family 2 domain-containing protein [Pseudomonas resinovorans]GLZ88411.1 hypothetical protein Pres01_44620 [Pseudomonas resinovorans]
MLQRVFWKLIPREQRSFLLSRLSAMDRQVVNRSMSARLGLPPQFSLNGCLFIHVPKCAGSSVSSALFGNWRPGHVPLYWYEQQFPEHYAQAFKFTFVRDPLERAYSAYSYLRNNKLRMRELPAQQMVCRYRDFDEFVSRWLHVDNVRKQVHFTPQTDFLVDSLGNLAMDFIGRQESLDRDFASLCQRFDIVAPLPHVNPTLQRQAVPVREFCSARTRRLVRRAYERDYEWLGYE